MSTSVDKSRRSPRLSAAESRARILAAARRGFTRAGYDTVYISGSLPDVADDTAPKGSVEAYGDTQTQTMSVLKHLGDALKAQGLGFGDVVAAHVFLVGDPLKNGDIDFAGMNAAFGQFFGTPEQPNKPARAAVKVAGLVAPGALVEIEFTAARAPAK